MSESASNPKSTHSAAPALRAQLVEYENRLPDAYGLLRERARAHFKQTGALEWCAAAESRIFSVYFRLGQHARARQALQPLPPGSFADRRIGLLMLRCRAEHAEGKSVIALLRQAADAEIKDLLPRNQVMLKIIMAVCAPAEDALEFGNAALEQAKQLGDPAAVVLAHAWLAEALRRNGRANEAAEFARLAWDGSRQRAPWGMEHVEFCWLVHQASEAGGLADVAREALQSARTWLQEALPHVPEHFVESFRYRNPVNREVLAKIARTQPSP